VQKITTDCFFSIAKFTVNSRHQFTVTFFIIFDCSTVAIYKRKLEFLILYYHKIFIFAGLEGWLIYDYDTECSFVHLILLRFVYINQSIFV